MKNIGFGLLVIIGALISVIASEAIAIAWLSSGPFDLTGSFFTMVVVPVHLLVQGIFVSAIAVILRRQAWLFLSIYVVVSMSAYGMLLPTLANPVSDVVRYELSTLFAIAIWALVNRNRIFQPAAA